MTGDQLSDGNVSYWRLHVVQQNLASFWNNQLPQFWGSYPVDRSSWILSNSGKFPPDYTASRALKQHFPHSLSGEPQMWQGT